MCECPKGTVPDPDPHTKCVGVVACTVDKDCPGNAICDSSRRCTCPEPNVGSDCRRKYSHSPRGAQEITKALNIVLLYYFF